MCGGVPVISPETELIDFGPTDDILTTNICFGGDDLRTAYITISTTGQLLETEWPRLGTKLHPLNLRAITSKLTQLSVCATVGDLVCRRGYTTTWRRRNDHYR